MINVLHSCIFFNHFAAHASAAESSAGRHLVTPENHWSPTWPQSFLHVYAPWRFVSPGDSVPSRKSGRSVTWPLQTSDGSSRTYGDPFCSIYKPTTILNMHKMSAARMTGEYGSHVRSLNWRNWNYIGPIITLPSTGHWHFSSNCSLYVISSYKCHFLTSGSSNVSSWIYLYTETCFNQLFLNGWRMIFHQDQALVIFMKAHVRCHH